MSKKYLNVDEVAEYLGLTSMAIYKKVARHEIPFIRIGKSCLRFDREVIDSWMKSKEVMPDGN